MARKRYTAEQIISKLREAEVEMAKGRTDQAKRLKELERENTRLKRFLADAELD